MSNVYGAGKYGQGLYSGGEVEPIMATTACQSGGSLVFVTGTYTIRPEATARCVSGGAAMAIKQWSIEPDPAGDGWEILSLNE